MPRAQPIGGWRPEAAGRTQEAGRFANEPALDLLPPIDDDLDFDAKNDDNQQQENEMA